MAFCGSLYKLMTCTSNSVRKNMFSMYSSDLKSYTSACETDPFLKSFDSSLRERTNQVIKSINFRGETQFLSLDSHMEAYNFLLQLNQDTVRFISENREDVWKNKDLISLVDDYFKSTVTTLDFCNTVENCVKKAETSRLIIRFAVKQFDIEENEKKTKYAKTLEELNKFKAIGDPFDGDFSTKYELVKEEQMALLEKLHKQKKKLDKKLKNVKIWKILSNVVFVTAFVTVLVSSVVAAASGSPDLLLMIPALAEPIVSTWKWCNDASKEYEKAIKRQKGVVTETEMGFRQFNVPMENIKAEVDNLRIKIGFMLETVEFAVEKEDEVKVKTAMEEIKKKIDEFTEKIELIGEAAAKCSKNIALARLAVMEHINMLPVGDSVADR